MAARCTDDSDDDLLERDCQSDTERAVLTVPDAADDDVDDDPAVQPSASSPDVTVVVEKDACGCEGCTMNTEGPKPFQPKNATVLSAFERGGRESSFPRGTASTSG